MALNGKLGSAGANAAADAVCALADGGRLRLYDGVQPADGDVALDTQALLAELRFAAPAFGAAVGGEAIAHAITPDSSAKSSGKAAWYRVLRADGTTVLWDGSVGTADANLILNAVEISAGAVVSLDWFTYLQAKKA